MTTRLNPYANMKLVQPFIDFSKAMAANSGLEPSLLELVKIRASQINGCSICLAMHTQEARHAGESEERIYMLNAWRESSLYNARERAALAWTEALTRLTETGAPDEDYEMMAAQFSAEEQVNLTMAIVVINGFNRLGVGFRVSPAIFQKRAA
ncbi:MAG TPA: carboxymuconolactone decarboxylase family protein [Rhizomicrobium sp.]|nr:carboxymuconolactone decarboxylase family protein [Rhizomicrobium sp.]